VALRAEVIDLVGINCFEHPPQSRSVGQIASSAKSDWSRRDGGRGRDGRWIRVEEAGAPHHAVDFMAFAEEELGKVRTILPGNPGDQRSLCHTCKHIRPLAIKMYDNRGNNWQTYGNATYGPGGRYQPVSRLK
jgi:hypothetical protein